jgi:hypothetical protein
MDANTAKVRAFVRHIRAEARCVRLGRPETTVLLSRRAVLDGVVKHLGATPEQIEAWLQEP